LLEKFGGRAPAHHKTCCENVVLNAGAPEAFAVNASRPTNINTRELRPLRGCFMFKLTKQCGCSVV
jgi:hypothetical protein